MGYKLNTLSLLAIIFFFANISFNTHAITPNLKEQWPMFGGPNANNQVTTTTSFKTDWSVRTGKNIKWHTELPAGGQSGITVWQNQVFLTINQPLDTPQYKVLENNYNQAQQAYQKLYNATLNSLKAKQNKQLILLKKSQISAKKNWQKLLQQREAKQLPNLHYQAKIKTVQWQTLQQSQQAMLDFVLTHHTSLPNLYTLFQDAKKRIQQKGMGSDIVLYSLDANTGAVLWTQTVKGTTNAMYNYTFSDATSPSPATDGKHIWVVNAAGGMAAFTMQGKEVWSRTFNVTKNAPFNKQYDTLLYNNMIFNVEPKAPADSTRVDNWNYLHAFDKSTGKRLWVSEDALTHYSTPVLSHTKKGKPAIMIGRGGPHNVAETPKGLSLVDIGPHSSGQSLWQWQAPTNNSQAFGGIEIQTWDSNTALWQQGFTFNSYEIYQLDSSTGKFKTKHKLNNVNQFKFNKTLQEYEFQKQPSLQGHFDRQPYTQVVVKNKLYYMMRYQPYIAYHDLQTGENILLEIPTEIMRKKDQPDQYIWQTPQKTDQLNSKGQRHNIEPRAQGDGTQKAFLGTPIVVNNKIFFTNAHGLTYVIDASQPFTPKALIAINDLGNAGQTVSLNTMAYSNGKLFHRSLKSIICIE